MLTKQSLSLCILGILLVQSQVLRAENRVWQTQWHYESKCKDNQTDECLLVHMNTVTHINLAINNLNKTELEENSATIRVISDSELLLVSRQIPLNEIDNGRWNGSVDIEAVFIGKSNLHVEITRKNLEAEQSQKLQVVIIRPERLIDMIFIISVAALVSILYINFGAALDLGKVKSVLRRPIGPAIAFCCHFVFLPLVSDTMTHAWERMQNSFQWKQIFSFSFSFTSNQSSYVLGQWLFPNNVEMQLGLLVTGSGPAGGASNTWTVLLGGNIDASITMSTTSTFAAFRMLLFKNFTLDLVWRLFIRSI